MPNPNAIVGNVLRLDPPLGQQPTDALRGGAGQSVHLSGARQIRLDPANPRSAGYAQILDGLRDLKLPVYLELDPQSQFITQLLIPLVSRVIDVLLSDDQSLTLELELSHARHLLTREQPDFDAMERVARAAFANRAPIILTEDDRHHLVDLRLLEVGPEVPLPAFLADRASLERWRPNVFRRWLNWFCFWRWCCCLSRTRAQQVFDAMSATSCNPLAAPPPCIPFMYPDDGCWARAHEMCRLMIAMGLAPEKVWIRGHLNTKTRNNPSCHVLWGYHVAPTLCVRGPKFYQTARHVIDPSLFTTPVTEAVWKSVQGDINATLTDTDASQYGPGGGTDPAYVDTNYWLTYFRLQLQLRALSVGPPPYAFCP